MQLHQTGPSLRPQNSQHAEFTQRGLCFRSLSRTEVLLHSNSDAIQSTIRLMRVWPKWSFDHEI